jgi:hypothetical protein
VPELPDVLLYLHALGPRIVGRRIERVRLASPFLLRSIQPPLDTVAGRTVVALSRLGKRVVNEANYCPTCQTGGRLLADRALSRLLREDWPRTLEELERRKGGSAGVGENRSARIAPAPRVQSSA